MVFISAAFLPPRATLVRAPGPSQVDGSKATLSVASTIPDVTLYSVLLGSAPTVFIVARPIVKDLPLTLPNACIARACSLPTRDSGEIKKPEPVLTPPPLNVS